MTDEAADMPASRLAREGRVVAAMIDLADTMISDFDVIEFLGRLSERCVELLDTDEAGVLLADPSGGLQPVASSSERASLLELYELQRVEGPSMDAFRTGQAVVVDDLVDESDRWPVFAVRARSIGFRAVVSVPLRLRSEVIGALNLLRATAGTPPDADLRVAQGLASMAAIALLQERALRESQATSLQLQSALSSRILLEQAKGVVAERHGVNVDDSFAAIRSYGRSHRVRLTELAHAIVHDRLDIRSAGPPH